MKIKAENYPVILIAAFFTGMVLAMALGFRPEYGSHRDRSHESGWVNVTLICGLVRESTAWQ
jgi:hypothetical protein